MFHRDSENSAKKPFSRFQIARFQGLSRFSTFSTYSSTSFLLGRSRRQTWVLHVKLGKESVTTLGVEKIGQDFDGLDLEEEKRLHDGEEKDVMTHVGLVGRLPVEGQLDQRSVTLGSGPGGISLSE